MFFFINVNAGDTIGPLVSAIIDNKDGAFCYERKYDSGSDKTVYVKTQKKYNYQENRSVSLKHDFSISDRYLKFDGKGYYDSDCYIDLRDIKLVPYKVDDNYNNIDNFIKYDNLKATLLKGEVELKKGIGDAFSTITKIISGEDFYYRYSLYNMYYVSYGNYEGWIANNNIFAYEDKDDNVIGIMPKNEEVTEYLKLSNGGYYVIYNGNKGIIKHGFAKTKGKVKIVEEAELYEDFEGEKILKKVNSGEEFEFNIFSEMGGDWESVTKLYIPIENAWLIIKASWYDYGGSYHDKDDEIIKIRDNCLHETITSNNNFWIPILVGIIILITIVFTIILIKIKKANFIKKV